MEFREGRRCARHMARVLRLGQGVGLEGEGRVGGKILLNSSIAG